MIDLNPHNKDSSFNHSHKMLRSKVPR